MVKPEDIAQGGRRLGSVRAGGEDLFWCESIAAEKGRRVIMRADSHNEITCLTPAPLQVKTRVHEYGGGEFCVTDHFVYFVDDSQKSFSQLYQIDLTTDNPQPIRIGFEYDEYFTATTIAVYLADLSVANDLLYAVIEIHDALFHEPQNAIARIQLNASNPKLEIVAEGSDFYAAPRAHPTRPECFCYIRWSHPNMPWDSSECVVFLEREHRVIACGVGVSTCQPAWGADGRLYFIADSTGWWNLYVCEVFNSAIPTALCPMDHEFGLPLWVFGMQNYCFFKESIIAAVYVDGRQQLIQIDTATRQTAWIKSQCTDFGDSIVAYKEGVAFIGGSPDSLPSVSYLDFLNHQSCSIRKDNDYVLSAENITQPIFLEIALADQSKTYAFFYKPKEIDNPPLIVLSHGGPTAYSPGILTLKVQFWTQRGFAVLDVNYRGSTGFGRAYREALNAQWGIVDVQDCISATQYVVKQGWVDSHRLIIKGSSAGGYTTLCALVFHDLYSAGVSYYGVADLNALVKDTHKFEKYYLEHLIGSYKQFPARYHERSPINYLEKLHCPLLILQGLQDNVVPPAQAEAICSALQANNLPYEYHTYPEEGHGFRLPETVIQSLQAELDFYFNTFNIAVTADFA